MELAVPLSQQQVDSAWGVHQTLKQWRLSETVLEKLNDKFPGFSDEACLLKTVALNAIYGTQLFATVRMANRVVMRVLAEMLALFALLLFREGLKLLAVV
jgi:hypothetical protein